jgi:hypothetical protein
VELHFRVVDRREFTRQSVEFWRHFAKKIKVQRAAVKKMLNVHQHGGKAAPPQQFLAGLKRLILVLFQAGQQ